MRSYAILLLALLALFAAGCGGDDDDDGGGSDGGGGAAATTEEQAPAEDTGGGGGGGEATRLTLVADPGGALKFDKTELTAKPGRVTVVMDNPSEVPHAVEIEGGGVEEATETLTSGTSEVTTDLKAGEYRFYCPVGNHAEAGMEGTLTVR
jgi:plastocyanin